MFLAFNLHDSADCQRLQIAPRFNDEDPEWAAEIEAAADRLDDIADDVELLDPALLARYAAARRRERELRSDDCLHCSMGMEIGFLLDPDTIEDVVHTYLRAVERLGADPRWRDPGADL